ncbi:MAG: DUF2958 domain-containing protein [Bifidobacteriales bacterium]|nr:DUF2958 domain-containing protein [Bifidobacteriales bacterium]
MLLTAALKEKLLRNGLLSSSGLRSDHAPVVKIFSPEGAATWLLTEIDPLNPDVAFGLCDLGHGCPELGYVSIAELSAARTPRLRLLLERDKLFTATKSISAYAAEARAAGRIKA